MQLSDEIEPESQQELFENPWPFLKDFFSIKSREGEKLFYNCELCKPKTVSIKAHTSTLNNLKQHVKTIHLPMFTQFMEKIKAGSSRGKRPVCSTSSITLVSPGSSELSAPKKVRQKLTIGESFGIAATGSGIPQPIVDKRIVEFFVGNMLPLHIVESNSFQNLILTLNPSKSSMSRRTLGRRILDMHTDLKQYLIRYWQ